MSTVPHGGVVDFMHGIEVRDPYRWLEDRSLPETGQWIDCQHQLCERYFSQNQFYRSLKKIVSNTLLVEEIDQAARIGSSVFLRKRLAGQEQAAIWVRPDGESADRLLVDPSALGSSVAVGIFRISIDGSLVAYSVRRSGSDAMEVRIAVVASGETLPDYLPSAYLRGFAFDSQGSGFYYCIEPTSRTGDPSIKYHRLSSSSLNDATLFSIRRAEHRRLTLLSRDGSLAAVVTDAEGAETVQDLYVATKDATHWTRAHGQIRGKQSPLLMHGRLFLFDLEEARNGRLLELRPPGDLPQVIVPECEYTIQRCWAIRGGFLVSYLADRKPRVEFWSVNGEKMGSLSLPAGEAIELLPQCSEQSSSIFFLRESYTEAPSLWEIDVSTQHLPEPRLRTATREVTLKAAIRECHYPSFDGTQIPLILIEPSMAHFEGPRPVILFGYGGFGSPEIPRYSRLAGILVQLGATIARPAIRGGTEFGEAWHQAATGRKKQLSIDDFLAAAQWLVSEGFTDQQNLAIVGSSNGGLLVAAAATQRPDLFRAVVCTGPLTDMVRYERFDRASKWRNEYGTVADADDFRALLAYSPYHNVKKGIEYPAMLFVTGDADDRCNPAHVRKIAAALQDRSVQREPILVDYGEHWGHVLTLSLTDRIEAVRRKIAFLCEQLNLTIPEGMSDESLGV